MALPQKGSVIPMLAIDEDKSIFIGVIMDRLETPFGQIAILVDGKSYPHLIKSIKPSERWCPDVKGRYHIIVDFAVDGEEHCISCIIPDMKYDDRGPEAGEMLECQAFHIGDWKLSVGVECESGNFHRYDYDAEYLENGMAYKILKNTKSSRYRFGIAWIDSITDNHARGTQTWFAADVTME